MVTNYVDVEVEVEMALGERGVRVQLNVEVEVEMALGVRGVRVQLISVRPQF